MNDPFKTILNFRDVGASINAASGCNLLITGKLFRSARLDEASPEDRQRLVDECHIKSIIDLRTTTEHLEQSKKKGSAVPSSAAIPKTEDQAAEPLKIPGLDYHEINLNGWGFARSMVSRLSWMDFGRLIGLMALGYRVEAIKIVGENVLKERGLVGLAIDTIDACGRELLQVFRVLSDESSYPLIVHCTQGKDRTGLVVMLVLFLLDVPIEAVNEDYLLSTSALEPEREHRLKETRSIGLPEEFTRCPPDMARRVSQHLTEQYGSTKEYLLGIGVTEAMQDSIRRVLCV